MNRSLLPLAPTQTSFHWSVSVASLKCGSSFKRQTKAILAEYLQRISQYELTENHLDISEIDGHIVRVVCPNEITAKEFRTQINKVTDGSLRASVNEPSVEINIEEEIKSFQEKADKGIESHDDKIKEVLMKLKRDIEPNNSKQDETNFVPFHEYEKLKEIKQL